MKRDCVSREQCSEKFFCLTSIVAAFIDERSELKRENSVARYRWGEVPK